MLLVEVLQSNPQVFTDMQPRRLSEVSLQSTVSGINDELPLQAVNACEFLPLLSINECKSILAGEGQMRRSKRRI